MLAQLGLLNEQSHGVSGSFLNIAMAKDRRFLRKWACAVAIFYGVLAPGVVLSQGRPDVPDAANLYPGRYNAVCTPAPIVGCVCTTDSPGEVLTFPELDRTSGNGLKDAGDTEYLRMIAWLRRTCITLTQSTSPR
jgi:hypothetical protein